MSRYAGFTRGGEVGQPADAPKGQVLAGGSRQAWQQQP